MEPGTLSGALGDLKSAIQIQSIIIIILIQETFICNICVNTNICSVVRIDSSIKLTTHPFLNGYITFFQRQLHLLFWYFNLFMVSLILTSCKWFESEKLCCLLSYIHSYTIQCIVYTHIVLNRDLYVE